MATLYHVWTMTSIKDKLRTIKSSFETPPVNPVPEPIPNRIPVSEMDARIVENQYGQYLLREKHYPFDFLHGPSLGSFLEHLPQDFILVGKDKSLAGLSPRDVLFFDTETTGLAGGTGTSAFLIGVGYFTDQEYIVRQYFMRDFHEETAMLYDLAELASNRSGLISFNGKSYDLPLLTNRFILNRLTAPWNDYPHLDLLHASRRMWKRHVESCTLQSLEAAILGFIRRGDVPGHEIPSLYFNYLRTGEFAPLVTVFKHNVMDILSMVGLVTRLVHLFHTPANELPVPVLLGIMRTCEELGMPESALQYCDSYLEAYSHNEGLVNVLEARGYLLKKLHRHTDSLPVWSQIIRLEPYFRPGPYIELAKVYEHHLKDYHGALEIVDRALERIELLNALYGDAYSGLARDFEYRRQRLIKRLANPLISE